MCLFAVFLPEPKEEYLPDLGDQPGFFPPPGIACTKPEKPDDPPLPIKPGGLVPNSVWIRLLWPQLVKKEKSMTETYIPPQMTAEQLAQIAGLKKVSSCILNALLTIVRTGICCGSKENGLAHVHFSSYSTPVLWN